MTGAVRWILGGALALYIAVLLGACTFQDRLVYFPDRSPAVIGEGWPIEAMDIETADGETLLAWHMAPREGCPVMLLFHGNAGHIAHPVGQYRALNEAGAGMLAVSWRGYTGSTGRPSEAGLHADAAAAYETLRALGHAPDEIVIHGFSLGSSPATRLAADVDAAALILEAPFYSARRLAEEILPVLPVGWIFRHPYRTDQVIAAVDEPLLIVHGSADEIVPVRHSADLAELAPDGTRRVVIEGARHNDLFPNGLYEEAIWPFLAPLYPDCPLQDPQEAARS